MIRSLFLLCFGILSLTHGLEAQITLDRSHMPSPGDAPISSIADTLLMLEPGPGGTDLRWDFRNLLPIAQRRDSFVAVPILYQAFFFGADLARFIPTPDSLGPISLDVAYQFYNKTSSAYENMGTGFEVSGIPVSLRNEPEDVVYRFPLTYGDRDTSTSQAELDLGTFGLDLYIFQRQTRINEVDGWGSLQTPYGSFEVLRVKTTLMAYDSVAFDTTNFAFERPEQVIYSWLSAEEVVPVLQMNQLRLGQQLQTVSVSYRDSLRNLNSVGLGTPLREARVRLYPNPARTYVQLDLPHSPAQGTRVDLLSLRGELLRKQALHQRTTRLSLEGLSPGMYLLRLLQHGQPFFGRLVILE